MQTIPLTVEPVSGALGAEISGLNLAEAQSDDAIAAVRAALLQYGVVFFRGQDLAPGQFQAFAERFGEPNEYPFVRGLDDYPRIIEVVKLEHERHNFGGVWHSDTTYLQEPPMATLLLARETPDQGGDTLFASQVLAYEALSDGMKRLLDGLTAIYSSTKAETSQTREDIIRNQSAGTATVADFPSHEAEHPVVRTHPETGRKSLYVNVAHTVRFKDMTEAESAPLLNYLFAHQVRPEFTCRFRWQPGSLAFWDNRAVQHNAINDYHGKRRIMHRITLVGDSPC